MTKKTYKRIDISGKLSTIKKIRQAEGDNVVDCSDILI